MYELTVPTHKWRQVNAKRTRKRLERGQGGLIVYPGVLRMQRGPLPVYGSANEEDSAAWCGDLISNGSEAEWGFSSGSAFTPMLQCYWYF